MTLLIGMHTIKLRQTLFGLPGVKPLDRKIQQTKPQESRARKLENGIAL